MADQKNPVPVNPGESTSAIRPGGTTLAGMIGSAAKPNPSATQAVNSAVSMSGHDRFLNALGVKTGVEADMARSNASASRRIQAATPTQKPLPALFARGMTVYDEEHDCKVTILQANAGHTAKTKTPVHKVSATNGRGVWLVKETKLKHLR